MDGVFGAVGLFARLFGNKGAANWDERIVTDVIRLTEDEPSDVTIIIPALQVELGGRLDRASKLMREKGYRLRQVIPESGMTWSASFIRLDD